MNKLYIAVLDTVPDHMVPVLVAHSVLGAHQKFKGSLSYEAWLTSNFRKCVVRVNKKEFSKLKGLDSSLIHLGGENTVHGGTASCAVYHPGYLKLPNVLRFAKLWSPKT